MKCCENGKPFFTSCHTQVQDITTNAKGKGKVVPVLK